MEFNFSANTGYLWTDLPFFERIKMAKLHGFHSVEFHDEPHSQDLVALKTLLSQLKLPVNSMNAHMGQSFGCAALPDEIPRARKDIREAIGIAEDIGVKALHILAGVTEDTSDAHEVFCANLEYALEHSMIEILIEPVCEEQLPGYFLKTVTQAAQVLDVINNPRLKIMFDCYHVFTQTGDVLKTFAKYVDKIGHVQISAAELRAEPFKGVLDYSLLLPQFQALGYQGPLGCEYRPKTKTADGLRWRDQF